MVAAFDLQPMSIGDILDRTVRLYRRDAVRILAIVALVYVPIAGVGWGLRHAEVEEAITTAVLFLLEYFGANIGLGALTRFVSERFLGRDADIWAAYRHVLRRAASLVWVLILYLLIWAGVPALAVGLALGLPAVFGLSDVPWWIMAAIGLAALAFIPGVVLSILAFFRLSLVTEVLILEDIRGRAALWRSWRLMRPNTGRAIVILLFWLIVRGIAWVVTEYPASGVAAASPGPMGDAVTAFASSLAGVLTVPFLAIAFILLYYDSRIRQEAFDLEVMARNLGASEGTVAARDAAVSRPRPATAGGDSAEPDATLIMGPGVAPAPPPAAGPAAALPPRDSAPPPPRGPAGSFKVCPTCNAQVPLVRAVCPTCGTAVPFRPR